MTEVFPTVHDFLDKRHQRCSCGGSLSLRFGVDDPLGAILSHGYAGESVAHEVVLGDDRQIDAFIRRMLIRWHFWQSDAGKREAARIDLEYNLT